MSFSNTGWNKLTPEEERVIIHKGEEAPFSGEYHEKDDFGSYLCRQCNKPLFRSYDKFFAGYGWPTFDAAVDGSIREIPESVSGRIEVVCNNCQAHIGYVVRGEEYTVASTRYCVKSTSLRFTED